MSESWYPYASEDPKKPYRSQRSNNPYNTDPASVEQSEKKPHSRQAIVGFICSVAGVIGIPVAYVFDYYVPFSLFALSFLLLGLGVVFGASGRKETEYDTRLATAAVWIPPIAILVSGVLLLAMAMLAIQGSVNSVGS